MRLHRIIWCSVMTWLSVIVYWLVFEKVHKRATGTKIVQINTSSSVISSVRKKEVSEKSFPFMTQQEIGKLASFNASKCELIVHDTGRLGNQIFQYVTILILAIKYRKQPCISEAGKILYCASNIHIGFSLYDS